MSEKHYTIRQAIFDAFGIVAKGLEEPRDLARLALLLRTAGHSLTLMCRGWAFEAIEKAAEEAERLLREPGREDVP